MQQHVLDDRVGACAVLDDLAEVTAEQPRDFGYLLFAALCEGNRLQHVPELLDKLQRQSRKVVHEIERVFNFMRDPGSQLTERRKLLGLDESILGGPKLL